MMTDTIVIKIGGNALAHMDNSFFTLLRRLQNQGKHVVIVHGGGPMISKTCTKLGLKVVKKHGIRVTDAATMSITKKLIMEDIQPKLLESLADNGLDAVGMNYQLKAPIEGDYLNQTEYGLVGTPKQLPACALANLKAGKILVFGPLCETAAHTDLNVNADSLAAFVAQELKVSRLIMMTDVPGLMYYGHVMPNVHFDQVQRLIDGGVLTSGMVPKIKEAYKAIHSGVGQVEICNDLSKPGTLVLP